MATTIKSTDLDFDAIKNNLKVFLQQQPEFADYNFEASGLSNLLDVMAYNTHYNALTANFALNESFLTTAQLRSSLVGLAGSLGYTVGSRTASFAVIQIYIENNDANAPASYTMPAGFSFTSTVDSKTYTYSTRDTLIATNDGNGRFFFANDGNINVPVYEGVARTKTFLADNSSGNDSYVLPSTNLDLDTVDVRVYDNTTTTLYDVYTNINDATTINEDSRIYVIKETPNGFYEITFGNGVRLGQSPVAGNKIEVLYNTVSGDEANGARTFTTESQIGGRELTIATISISAGGALKEDIESIRKNAPYLYATQNRMVTAEDYSALILRNFRGVIQDIKAWGGEDNIPPNYGSVFVSIVFSTDDENIQTSTKSDIVTLAKDLSVASFDVLFTDPVETYLEVDIRFQFNPNLTSLSKSQVETSVANVVRSYFDTNLGNFDQSFRRSNMLTDIDVVDNSVLSSRAAVKMQYRFTPTPLVDSYTIQYPTSIATPEDDIRIIRSGNFLLNGAVCYLQNKLDSLVIEVVDTSTGDVFIDNVGTYDANTGVLTLSGFSPVLISGDYIKITATPANESVINAVRNNILLYDANESTVTGIVTSTV